MTHGLAEEPLRPSSRAARWIAEVIVIALGILLAFFVDAAWTARQEAAQERRTLEALQEEFRANHATLLASHEGHVEVSLAGRSLLRLTGPGVDSSEEAAFLIGEIWIPIRSQLATGAIGALLSTSELAQVSNPELRQALAAWPERAAGLRRLEDNAAANASEGILPLIQFSVPQIDIERANGFRDFPGIREEFSRTVNPSQFPSDLTPLLRDIRFENSVVNRVTGAMLSAAATQRLADEAQRILSLIEDGLGG